jgi:hypothetical protein
MVGQRDSPVQTPSVCPAGGAPILAITVGSEQTVLPSLAPFCELAPVSVWNPVLAPEVLKKDGQSLLIQVQRVRKIALLPNVINKINKPYPVRIGKCLQVVEEGRQIVNFADALRQHGCHDHDGIDVLFLEIRQHVR